jgi:uncharacterized membrane protein
VIHTQHLRRFEGAKLMDSNPNDPTYNAPPQEVIPPAPVPAAGGLSENSAAALSYLTFIPAIIFLVMEPYNRSAFVRFHAIQCIAFSVVAFAIHLVLMFIPIIGWLISLLLTVVFFILWVMCIMKASKGEWYKLPFIGDFAMSQAKA